MPNDLLLIQHPIFELSLVQTNNFACNEGPPADATGHGEKHLMLAKIYVLAEKFHDTRCQNSLIDTVIEIGCLRSSRKPQQAWYFTGPEVDIIYEGTREGDPLRRLVVDTHVKIGIGKWVAGHEIKNVEFLAELCSRMLDERAKERRSSMKSFEAVLDESRSYRKHERGKSCAKTA